VREKIYQAKESAWEAVLSNDPIRRTISLVVGLLLNLYPCLVAWRLLVERDFSTISLGRMIWMGVFFLLGLWIFAQSVLPSLGLRPVHAAVAFVPVLGALFLMPWMLKFDARWKEQQHETEV
jgi:membrane associated rhomboid family serine protease